MRALHGDMLRPAVFISVTCGASWKRTYAAAELNWPTKCLTLGLHDMIEMVDAGVEVPLPDENLPYADYWSSSWRVLLKWLEAKRCRTGVKIRRKLIWMEAVLTSNSQWWIAEAMQWRRWSYKDFIDPVSAMLKPKGKSRWWWIVPTVVFWRSFDDRLGSWDWVSSGVKSQRSKLMSLVRVGNHGWGNTNSWLKQ